MQTHLKAGSTLSTDNRSVPGAKGKSGIWEHLFFGRSTTYRRMKTNPVPTGCWLYPYVSLPHVGPEFFPTCSWSPCRDSLIIRASGGQNSTCPSAQNLGLSHCLVIMSYGTGGFRRRFSRWILPNLMSSLRSREFSLMAEEEERFEAEQGLSVPWGSRAFKKECG